MKEIGPFQIPREFFDWSVLKARLRRKRRVARDFMISQERRWARNQVTLTKAIRMERSESKLGRDFRRAFKNAYSDNFWLRFGKEYRIRFVGAA